MRYNQCRPEVRSFWQQDPGAAGIPWRSGSWIPERAYLVNFCLTYSTRSSAPKGRGGQGLGLSVCYGFIKKHKGDIRVESKVGVGTTFTIELPIYKKPPASSEER